MMTFRATAIRAVADNPDLARISGIPTERVVLFSLVEAVDVAAIYADLVAQTDFLKSGMGVAFTIPIGAMVAGVTSSMLGIVGSMVLGGLVVLTAALIAAAIGFSSARRRGVAPAQPMKPRQAQVRSGTGGDD